MTVSLDSPDDEEWLYEDVVNSDIVAQVDGSAISCLTDGLGSTSIGSTRETPLSLLEDSGRVNHELELLRIQNKVLLKNITRLYLTAKKELFLKDKEISRLKEQLGQREGSGKHVKRSSFAYEQRN